MVVSAKRKIIVSLAALVMVGVFGFMFSSTKFFKGSTKDAEEAQREAEEAVMLNVYGAEEETVTIDFDSDTSYTLGEWTIAGEQNIQVNALEIYLGYYTNDVSIEDYFEDLTITATNYTFDNDLDVQEVSYSGFKDPGTYSLNSYFTGSTSGTFTLTGKPISNKGQDFLNNYNGSQTSLRITEIADPDDDYAIYDTQTDSDPINYDPNTSYGGYVLNASTNVSYSCASLTIVQSASDLNEVTLSVDMETQENEELAFWDKMKKFFMAFSFVELEQTVSVTGTVEVYTPTVVLETVGTGTFYVSGSSTGYTASISDLWSDYDETGYFTYVNGNDNDVITASIEGEDSLCTDTVSVDFESIDESLFELNPLSSEIVVNQVDWGTDTEYTLGEWELSSTNQLTFPSGSSVLYIGDPSNGVDVEDYFYDITYEFLNNSYVEEYGWSTADSTTEYDLSTSDFTYPAWTSNFTVSAKGKPISSELLAETFYNSGVYAQEVSWAINTISLNSVEYTYEEYPAYFGFEQNGYTPGGYTIESIEDYQYDYDLACTTLNLLPNEYEIDIDATSVDDIDLTIEIESAESENLTSFWQRLMAFSIPANVWTGELILSTDGSGTFEDEDANTGTGLSIWVSGESSTTYATYKSGAVGDTITTYINGEDSICKDTLAITQDSTDDDGDGLSDLLEKKILGYDPDNTDSDGDGTEDGDEDYDSDGLTNLEEIDTYLTDPTLDDTDGDGYLDGEEVTNSTDPLVAEEVDDDSDVDDDGISNILEIRKFGYDPDDVDSDDDGTEDGDEDYDGDGLTNLEELDTYETSPFESDSDEDGTDDGDEVSNGTDPLVAEEEEEEEEEDPDYDDDGLTNDDETDTYETDPYDEDSDGDDVSDYEEIMTFETDPNDEDSDGDGFDDGYEIEKETDPLDDTDYPKTKRITEESDCPFTDIVDHWSEEYVCGLYEDNIVSGRSATLYEPDDDVTRAEFLKMIMLVAGLDPTYHTGLTVTKYSDVNPGDWYYDYVALADSYGDLWYAGSGTWQPNENITRGDAILLVMRFANQTLYDFTEDDSSFTDFDEDSYQAYAIILAEQYEIITGYDDGEFKPDNSITRAEAAVVVSKSEAALF